VSRWFRMYDEILDDPKVQRLSGDDFKGWVNILCLASRNGGKLPPIEDVAFALRETLDGARTLVERLVNATLIERRTGGSNGAHYAPYKWDERQYKSDTSTDRVKRFRQRSKPVPETAPDTESETETERKKKVTAPKSAAPLIFEGKVIRLNQADFSQWQRAYPDIDLPAVLQARDDWLVEEADGDTRKKWFIATSNHLANLQQKATATRREAASYDRDRITV
jgi:hypothetical protein